MPGLHIPSGYSQCSFVHQQVDTLQLAVTTCGFNTDVVTDLVIVGDAWRDHMLAEMSNKFRYVKFTAVVAAGTLYQQTYATLGSGGGTATSPQVSYLYRKNTTVPGRKNHGRMYYPGCDTTSVDADGKVSTGKQGGLNIQSAAFLTALLAGGALTAPVILHHDLVTTPTPVGTLTAEPVVATQRRRLRR